MRALIFGGTGMLGQSLVREGRHRGWPSLGLSKAQADITREASLRPFFESFRPSIVFNCAAFTHVDLCETERDLAFAINGDAVGNLARLCEEYKVPLGHVSSDYVFDGTSQTPYLETSNINPQSVYGKSKRRGEEAALAYSEAFVVRASWLFGPYGPNFVGTMLRLADGGMNPLRVVDDQVGAPTYTPYLAKAMADLAESRCSGLIHYVNRSPVSWFQFTQEILRQARPAVEVVPVSTEAFPRPAPRPAYSVLDTTRFRDIIGREPEAWSAGLAHYLSGLP